MKFAIGFLTCVTFLLLLDLNRRNRLMFILASSANCSMSWMRLRRELILLRLRSTSCASRAVTLAPRYCPMLAALTCMLLCSSVFVQTNTVTIQSVPVQTVLDALASSSGPRNFSISTTCRAPEPLFVPRRSNTRFMLSMKACHIFLV